VMMMYNAQDYCFTFICPFCSILMNTVFHKLDLFPSSGEGVGDTYSVGSVTKS
jgi:hypothetical protein